MKHEFFLLEHVSFSQQTKDFLAKFTDPKNKALAERQLLTALERTLSNPFDQKALAEIETRALRGLIRRTYIGGNERFRLFYLCPPACSYLIPFYISEERRSSFRYDDRTIEKIERLAMPILNDYNQKRYSQFKYWKPS